MTEPMVREPASALEQEVAELVRASASAPLPMVQLEVDRAPDGPTVRGLVVTPGQARQVRRIADAYGARTELRVLADPEQRLEEGWLAVTGEGLTDGILEVWRDPALMGRDHARQTEYLSADGPLRLLGRSGAARLVQGPDLTTGWIGEAGVTETEGEAARLHWQGRRRTEEGDAVLPDPGLLKFGGGGMEMLAGVVEAARAQLGAPYRWGGTNPRGFDCSGLIQRVFAGAVGVLLPKHTGDQRHSGVRVTATDARAGDLLFAAPKSQRVGHVMLVTAPGTVLHACRTEMKVIEEPLSANAKRYQHQGYRRPVLLLP